jgi:zinc transport system substrate-binding protein
VIVLTLGLAGCASSGASNGSRDGANQASDSAASAESVGSAESSGKTPVTVSIVPQRYFVERLAGEFTDVSVMVPPGSAPSTYEPRPSQLSALSNAEAYFRIRVPFENAWIDRIQSAGGDEMRMVDTAKSIDRGKLPNGKPDPHIWLSPPLVKRQVRTYTSALTDLMPEHAQAIRDNADAFIEDLAELDAQLSEILADHEGETLMTFHPAWGYLSEAYGLEMLAIEQGGSEPSAAELTEIIDEGKQANVNVVFIQPQFARSSVETIAAELGAEVQRANPLAADWLANMRTLAETFAEAFETKR